MAGGVEETDFMARAIGIFQHRRQTTRVIFDRIDSVFKTHPTCKFIDFVTVAHDRVSLLSVPVVTTELKPFPPLTNSKASLPKESQLLLHCFQFSFICFEQCSY